MIEQRRIDPSFVISHRLPLEDAPQAFATFRDKEDNRDTSTLLVTLWSARAPRVGSKIIHALVTKSLNV